MKIADMHPVDRPRERLARLGAGALGEAELLAIVLGTGYKGRSALEVGRDLARLCPAGALGRTSLAELARLKGVGPSRAAVLASAAELGRRWASEGRGPAPLESPDRVWENLHDLRGKRQEHFVVLYLDARSRLAHRETVSIGTLTASLVHPREVFAPAVERRAAAVIVAHNHPSGDVKPSEEDRQATGRLSKAGRLLGIELLDHVVVAEGGYFSFRQEGLM